MPQIERITLFKIPNEDGLNRVLEQYKVLARTAVKVYTQPPLVISPYIRRRRLITETGRKTLHRQRGRGQIHSRFPQQRVQSLGQDDVCVAGGYAVL